MVCHHLLLLLLRLHPCTALPFEVCPRRAPRDSGLCLCSRAMVHCKLGMGIGGGCWLRTRMVHRRMLHGVPRALMIAWARGVRLVRRGYPWYTGAGKGILGTDTLGLGLGVGLGVAVGVGVGCSLVRMWGSGAAHG